MIPLFQFSLFGNNGIDPTTIGETGAYDIFTIVLRFLQIALVIIGVIAVIYIIMAGFQYIFAAGVDAKQVEAKKTIQAAIIGLIIVMSAFLITGQLLQTLGFNATIKQEINNSVRSSTKGETGKQPDLIQ